jgi:hypothetical protein
MRGRELDDLVARKQASGCARWRTVNGMARP